MTLTGTGALVYTHGRRILPPPWLAMLRYMELQLLEVVGIVAWGRLDAQVLGLWKDGQRACSAVFCSTCVQLSGPGPQRLTRDIRADYSGKLTIYGTFISSIQVERKAL